MCSSFYRVDVVYIRVDILAVVGVVHDCHLNRYALLFGFQIDDIIKEMGAVAVNVANEFFQTVNGMENFLTWLSVLLLALVCERDFDTRVQIGQFAHTACNNVPLEGCCSENASIRPELLACSAFLCGSNHLYGIKGLALFILLLVDLTVTEHL